MTSTLKNQNDLRNEYDTKKMEATPKTKTLNDDDYLLRFRNERQPKRLQEQVHAHAQDSLVKMCPIITGKTVNPAIYSNIF